MSWLKMLQYMNMHLPVISTEMSMMDHGCVFCMFTLVDSKTAPNDISTIWPNTVYLPNYLVRAEYL